VATAEARDRLFEHRLGGRPVARRDRHPQAPEPCLDPLAAGEDRLCGENAGDAGLGHRLLLGEEDLVQALARPRAGDLDGDVLAGLEAG
jgi:hypothetical protein